MRQSGRSNDQGAAGSRDQGAAGSCNQGAAGSRDQVATGSNVQVAARAAVPSNPNVADSDVMPPPTWGSTSGHLNGASSGRRTPSFLESRLSAPMVPRPATPPPRQVPIPHPSIIDQPIRILGNLPMPQSPARDLNQPRGPPPQTVYVRILTGSINQIMEWTENIQGVLIFEATGYLFGVGMVNPVYPPAPGNEINLLLRDRPDSGPIFQVIQPYHLYPEMPRGIQTGQLLRCVGKVLDARRMLAIKVSVVPPNEVTDYNRLGHVCRFTS